MSTIHNQSFKNQAVENVLSRASGITMSELTTQLGVSRSTLYRWVDDARNNNQNQGVSQLDLCIPRSFDLLHVIPSSLHD